MTKTEENYLDDIYGFVKGYFSDATELSIKEFIWTHWFYGTIDLVYKEDKPIACCRWNISPSGKVVEVLDLFIIKGEDGMRIMKHLIARNWHRFPSARYIGFARSRKYGHRKERLYKITKILHLKELV